MQQTLLSFATPNPSDPARDFVLYVEMDLKQTLDRKDVLAPVKVPEAAKITPAVVATAFSEFAKRLRPVFEEKTTFSLILSGRVVTSDGRPSRFINLWDIGLPDEIPRMMEALALDEDKSQLYGHLDYLVERESQDLLRVFPFPKVSLSKPASGEKRYYVILEHKPQTVDLYQFKIEFGAYREPALEPGVKANLVASTIANTGVLNRIIQFWAVDLDERANQFFDSIILGLFSGLPWRKERYNPEVPVILDPTSWDVLYDTPGAKP